MTDERIIAVALLTQSDIDRLGGDFSRLWPVDETQCFNSLLYEIDVADRDLRRAREAAEGSASQHLVLQLPLRP
jgi:hypothetical protein